MAIHQLNPYLNFPGNAAYAIELYERALGAKTEQLMRHGDAPGMAAAPEQRGRVLHAELRLGAGVLMLCDEPQGQSLPAASRSHVALHFDDVAEMERRFEALAAGGVVTMPLQDTFWGAKFGMLTDVFGVRWMFNCSLERA